jgi:hypothetical protein
MLNIQKKRRSWALYFAGFLLFIQLFSVLSSAVPASALTPELPGSGGTPTADTTPYGQASVTQKAAVWALARAAAHCINDATGVYRGQLSESDANSGKWFTMDNSKPVGEYTGLVVEGTSSDDNKAPCDNVLKKLFDQTGIKGTAFLCEMGFTRDAAAGSCESGIGNYKTPDKISNGDQLEKAWSSAFIKLWGGGKTYSNMLTSGMKYYIYFNEFRQACGQGDGGSSDRTLGWSVEPWNDQVTTKQLEADKQAYHIPWFTGGQIQDSYVVSSNYDEGQKVDIDGWNTDGEFNYLDRDLKDNGGNDVNNNLKCHSLATNMNILAPAATAEFAADAAAGKSQTGAGALSSGDASDRANSCEASNGALAWLGCAILEAMDGVVGFLDKQIRTLLTVQTSALDEGGGLKKAWGIMRNFAYLILVPLMLLMVIGTAIGFGPFDPYTVKKALPRMVSAVIFMSISYYLCIFLINISNDVGRGIFNLVNLAAPGGAVNSLTDVLGPKDGGLFAALAVGGSGIALAANTLGDGQIIWGLLGSFALVTIVALLIGYVVLVIRQVLVIMLVVLSPLAILVWIFPGNDKLWNIWKTTFTAMLMMFPLIMVLISSGRFFAATVDTTFGGATGTFIKLIAYIAPYFFIPATFKYGLGVFGNVAGMINDRGRGIFDRQRKYRQGKYGQARHDFTTGNSRNAFVSRVGQRAGVGMTGRFGIGQRGLEARARMDQTTNMEAIKDPKSQSLALNSDDGNAVMALSGGTGAGAVAASHDLARGWAAANPNMSAAEIEERRLSAVAAAQGTGISRSRAIAAGQLMMQNKARSVNGGDWGTIQRGINRLHGDNAQAADAHSQTLRYAAMEGGRSDFASTGDMTDPNALRAGFDRAGAAKVAGGHVNALRAQAADLVTRYNTAVTNGDAAEAFEAAHRMTALRNAESAGYTAEENKDIIYNMLDQAGIDLSAPQDTAEQFGHLIGQTVPGWQNNPAGNQQLATNTAENIRARAATFERGSNTPYNPNNPNNQGNPNNPQQSDRRLKKNIHHVTTTSSGIKLYRFNYIWDSSQTYVGVMAQDLLGTGYAHAVTSQSPEGYYRVDYSALGLQMVTLEQWTSDPGSVYASQPDQLNKII